MTGATLTLGAAFMEGAEVGGEVGGAATIETGPGALIGAAAGALVGGLLAVGAYALMNRANDKADEKLKDSAQDEACADCGDGPDCFTPPDGADEDEFEKQLQEQQDEINKLSPDEMLDRLNAGDKRLADTGSYRGEGDSAARQAARQKEFDSVFDRQFKNYRRAGQNPAQATASATKDADAALVGKDATHGLDWIAGGDGEISGLGDRSINRSIGSQWRHTGEGSKLSRREQLRKAAEKAKSQGKDKMDVDLKKCED